MGKTTLAGLRKTKPTLVGIDSDGCVFDSMTVKQVECFHPEILRIWDLGRIEPVVRETAEFVNLYSRWRGTHRFPALWKTFDLLRRRPEAGASGVAVPDLSSLKAYMDARHPLQQDCLAKEVERTGDPELRRVLEWSRAVNAAVERKVTEIPLFPGVREALEHMSAASELMVVSQTPVEAILREWRAQDIDGWVSVIAGQEQGTKTEHVKEASAGWWDSDHMLLIGDAPGDWTAAREAGACFFPIEPGNEPASWERLVSEGYGRFLRGEYRGSYEEACIERFLARLPEKAPWEQD